MKLRLVNFKRFEICCMLAWFLLIQSVQYMIRYNTSDLRKIFLVEILSKIYIFIYIIDLTLCRFYLIDDKLIDNGRLFNFLKGF